MNKLYLSNIRKLLNQIENSEEVITTVAEKCADAICNNKLLYFFGTGHSSIVCEEPFYRAGGLACISPILVPMLMLHESASKSSVYERIEGLGTKIIGQSGIGEGDVIFLISNSGRNCCIIDAAIEAKKVGATTVAITSLKHTKSVTSRHSSGKLLYEICDYTLDNFGEPGDASVKIGENKKIGPTSSVIDIILVNSLIIDIVEILEKRGIKPPIFTSANIDEGDLENKSILETYRKRIPVL